MAALQFAGVFGLATVHSALFDLQIDREGGLLSTLTGVPVTGSEVTGTLKILTEAPVPYKKVIVTLKGEANVKVYSYNTHTWTHGPEAFLSKTLVLKESSTPGSSDELEKGSHDFPFKFEINEENLPASQTTEQLDINYSVEAHLHKGLPVARVPFPYAGTFSLAGGKLVQSVSADTEKSVLFASGPIRLFVELESSVIHVGKVVNMTVNVENNTGRSLGLKAAIKGRAHLSIRNRYKMLWAPNKTVAKDTRETHVAPHSSVEWKPDGIVFPQTEPTTMSLPRAQVTHFMRVRASVRLGSDCVVDIPITVV